MWEAAFRDNLDYVATLLPRAMAEFSRNATYSPPYFVLGWTIRNCWYLTIFDSPSKWLFLLYLLNISGGLALSSWGRPLIPFKGKFVHCLRFQVEASQIILLANRRALQAWVRTLPFLSPAGWVWDYFLPFLNLFFPIFEMGTTPPSPLGIWKIEGGSWWTVKYSGQGDVIRYLLCSQPEGCRWATRGGQDRSHVTLPSRNW